MAQFLQAFQCNRPLLAEGAHAGAAQRADMAAGAERSGQIAHQGADIGALAAIDLDGQVIRVRGVRPRARRWIGHPRGARSTATPSRARS